MERADLDRIWVPLEVYTVYNHISVQTANGCLWYLGTICWAYGKFHIKTLFQLWPKNEEKYCVSEKSTLWMSFPYPQCCELKLLGRGDLNETKATGGRHRALCPPVTAPRFAQLWPGPQTRLKPWCEEWSWICSNSSCSVEQTVASLPFPNMTLLHIVWFFHQEQRLGILIYYGKAKNSFSLGKPKPKKWRLK